MSDIMVCMPFSKLLNWVMEEYNTKGTVFGVHHPYTFKQRKGYTIFQRNLETPIGPAAGPNSQLAQNIAASYYAGSRFFELKTVQIMDGAKLAACVNKPCIKAEDECYNCEWSTELYVPQAQDEYIKAWFLLAVLAKEYGLGSLDGFQFNISVGYDLKGIKSPKIDGFIENMKHAESTEVFKECKQYLLDLAGSFRKLTREEIEGISPRICNSVTISTLHGCPPKEIESIAEYLLDEKGMHTFIKCNPTLLGYEFARETLDKMGYDYISFGRFHFEHDLQYVDAVPMLQRLMKLSGEKCLEFGVKITNTFPVDVKAGELKSKEMYMSGKSLFPLAISLAAKLSKEFNGKLRISYSGGADAFNIGRIVGAGVWPVTVATTTLKPGGYQRMKQMAEVLEEKKPEDFNGTFQGIKVDALTKLSEDAKKDPHHVKPAKWKVSRKSNEKVPLLDCYRAPCQDACPIHQEIPLYVGLAGEGDYEGALKIIMNRNALPFITGTICAHGCMDHCNRNFYETPVQIRDTKLKCANQAFASALGSLKSTGTCGKKVAVVGAGPSGMAAAFYLARAGARVTVFEKRPVPGGIVSCVIPDFRIDGSVIQKDASFLEKLGVDIRYNTKAPEVAKLKSDGYDNVILAVGAYKHGELKLPGGDTINALEFLEEYHARKGQLTPGKHVVVIGGGNTAMDTARAARRCEGVAHVYLVYRRTKRYMPADEHELLLTEKDGVEVMELLAPVKVEGKELVCKKTILGAPDASLRAGVVETDELCRIPADYVIAAVGERVPTEFYKKNGLSVDEKGRPKVNDCLETNVEGVYIIGDGLYGPSVVVQGMANAITVAEAITGTCISEDLERPAKKKEIYAKKGILREPGEGPEAVRCLGCSTVCENCVDVCPNRANISISVPGMDKEQVIHVDYMCNECGNCKSFCPYDSSPYLEKFTLFADETAMDESKNDGFAVIKDVDGCISYKVRYLGEKLDNVTEEESRVPGGIRKLIEAVCTEYSYLL